VSGPLKLVWNREGVGAAPIDASPFAALLRAAEHDAEAAEGLALAYAALAPDERARLVATVIEDSSESGRSPTAVLALLLGIEDVPELAAMLASALCDAASRELVRRGGDAGWSWGGERDGGVAIARQREDGLLDLVCVRWLDGDLDAHARALVRREELAEAHEHLGIPEAAERVEARAAIDRLAEVLWRARRTRGGLPETLRGLADLFEPLR
jgi:hypothetical protein